MRALGGIDEVAALQEQRVFVAAFANPVFDFKRAAFGEHALDFLAILGAIVGMTSVILMSILGQPRIFMAMARDGLLPPQLEKVHPKYHTPSIATVITGVLAAFFAGVFERTMRRWLS